MEELDQLKNPMILSGNEPSCLNQLRYRVTQEVSRTFGK
jgi:hypothetical protein